jgi:hypothetical protein
MPITIGVDEDGLAYSREQERREKLQEYADEAGSMVGVCGSCGHAANATEDACFDRNKVCAYCTLALMTGPEVNALCVRAQANKSSALEVLLEEGDAK